MCSCIQSDFLYQISDAESRSTLVKLLIIIKIVSQRVIDKDMADSAYGTLEFVSHEDLTKVTPTKSEHHWQSELTRSKTASK